jgi:WD40 repeat protein
VPSIAFSPDGHTLATASEDETARLWEVATGKEIAVLRGHENS